MKWRYAGLAMAVMIVLGAALSLPSCGHDQKLVSITITPSTFTFLQPDPALEVQYTAMATYIHPPATKDITSQATWKVDFAQLVTTSGPGIYSPEGTHCGVANVSASAPEGTGGSSNIVTGYATVTVDDPAVPSCPGGGTVGTLSVQVTGNGQVTSAPTGISCPNICIATYTAGTQVVLTGTPGSGATSVTFNGCAQVGNTCTVTVPAAGTAVSAVFE